MRENHDISGGSRLAADPLLPEGNRLWLEIGKHVLVWLLIFLLPYLVRFSYTDRFFGSGPFSGGIFNAESGIKLIWVLVFYLNAFLFVPLYFSRKKYFIYGIVLLILFALVILLHDSLMSFFFSESGTLVHYRSFDNGPVNLTQSITAIRDSAIDGPEPAFQVTRALPVIPGRMATTAPAAGMAVRASFSFLGALTFNLAPYSLTIAAGILYRMLRDKARADRLARQKQAENLKTELSFLRSQVSPHFLFNVLNNITSLARKKSDELEPTIIKLSSLMRYMLYEANEEKVLLKTEVEYLNSYIELQRQRFGDKVAISVQLENGEDAEARIEPMLLIPFVENAFKHGVGFLPQPQIDISLKAGAGVLVFQVDNKCNKDEEELKDTASGIGLANVQRRLNLLYGEEHVLDIHKETDPENNIWFRITLHVKLHE